MENKWLSDGEAVYSKTKDSDLVLFNQLAVKIEMDTVSNEDYFAWLDRMADEIGSRVPGAQIAEKEDSRIVPLLNTAVYYGTSNYALLPTGSLLRTSCNRITHAFCAFKLVQDKHSVRRDYRYVFADEEKRAIQIVPTSEKSVGIVRRLLARTDIEHPGTYVQRYYGINSISSWVLALSQATETVPVGCFSISALSNRAISLRRFWRSKCTTVSPVK